MDNRMIRLAAFLVILMASAGCLTSRVAAQELLPVSPGVTVLRDRTIPSPVGVSSEMTAIIASRQIPADLPLPTTTEGWLEFQRVFDEPGGELARQGAEHLGATYEVQEIAGVRTYVVTPRMINKRFADRVFVHVHGGAFVFGGGDSAMREAIWAAHGLGVKVISVDYRRPPTYPFPAAIDDVIAVWEEVTKDQSAGETALFGTSAGGNITLATVLKLKELGKPLPGAVFAGTPATDLENTTDTWYTLEGLDPLGKREGLISTTFTLYAAGEDLSNPMLSPVNGDLKDFPPTILISGTRDLLLSDTVRMHRALRAAGVVADLHVYDGQAHGDYLQNLIRHVPEAEDAQRELFEFFDKHLK
uniref:Lipolytic enzyme n=1 Tax=uncultured marine bacterium TaxID=56765 RepID=D2KLA1_9BACT|nr:lipolytic enzyme precursor [uncultured marine bacterium]